MSINSKTKAAVDTLLTDNATTEAQFQTGLQDITTELDLAQQKLIGNVAQDGVALTNSFIDGGTLGGNIPVRFIETEETVYSLSGTLIDPDNGAVQYKTLSANTTFTEALTTGQSIILRISGGDLYTITWPTLTWVTSVGNIVPTQTADDVYVLWKEGSTLYAAYTGSYV